MVVAVIVMSVSPCLELVWCCRGGDVFAGWTVFADNEKGRWVIPAASCVLVVVVNLRE